MIKIEQHKYWNFVGSTIIQSKLEHKGKRFYSHNILKCLVLKFKILAEIKFL